MSEKTINLDNKNINNSSFYRTKRLFNVDDIGIDKILISKKDSYGKKDLKHLNILLLMKIMIIWVLFMYKASSND